MDKKTKKLVGLDAVDGTVYGAYNKVNMVNPYKSMFEVTYTSGEVQRGNNLYDTGWCDVKDGIKELRYILSTGHVIVIPRFTAYLPTIEVSESIDGFKMFHAIHVKCLADNKIVKYTIILKEDMISKYKIGDILISEDYDLNHKSMYWKLTG